MSELQLVQQQLANLHAEVERAESARDVDETSRLKFEVRPPSMSGCCLNPADSSGRLRYYALRCRRAGRSRSWLVDGPPLTALRLPTAHRLSVLPFVQVRPKLKKRRKEVVRKIEEYRASVENQVMLSDVIGPDHIAEIVSASTGIPVSRLSTTDRERILQLSARLHERVIGQDDAVDAVANAVLRARAGLGRAGIPGGAFLFLGWCRRCHRSCRSDCGRAS